MCLLNMNVLNEMIKQNRSIKVPKNFPIRVPLDLQIASIAIRKARCFTLDTSDKYAYIDALVVIVKPVNELGMVTVKIIKSNGHLSGFCIEKLKYYPEYSLLTNKMQSYRNKCSITFPNYEPIALIDQ